MGSSPASVYIPQNFEFDGVDHQVPLAPVRGIDERRALPPEMFVRHPGIFVTKFLFAFASIGICWAAIYALQSWVAVAAAMLVAGLAYAHLVELQHECLHGHAFRSPKLNRVFGVLCGIFMLSSHSHYRYDHLRHHANLGTDRNKEHFDYRFQNLDSFWGFTRSFFDLSRFKRLAAYTGKSLLWQHLPGIEKPAYDRDIKQEYIINFVFLAASVAVSIYAQSWFFALAWWIPLVLVSEGVHFLIELPEHFGLNTQTDPNVLANTRSIKTGRVVSWFVNGNDMHTAHHFHQGVPMCNVRRLHKLIEPKIDSYDPSYRRFYWDVLKGNVKQLKELSAMKR